MRRREFIRLTTAAMAMPPWWDIWTSPMTISASGFVDLTKNTLAIETVTGGTFQYNVAGVNPSDTAADPGGFGTPIRRFQSTEVAGGTASYARLRMTFGTPVANLWTIQKYRWTNDSAAQIGAIQALSIRDSTDAILIASLSSGASFGRWGLHGSATYNLTHNLLIDTTYIIKTGWDIDTVTGDQTYSAYEYTGGAWVNLFAAPVVVNTDPATRAGYLQPICLPATATSNSTGGTKTVYHGQYLFWGATDAQVTALWITSQQGRSRGRSRGRGGDDA